MSVYLKTGLIGWPVAHSMSPVIHELFMKEAGIRGKYFLFPVEPGNLSSRVTRLKHEGFTGLNVTIPYKKSVIHLCSSLSKDAEVSGAVNTLRFSSEEVLGFNTDISGFSALSMGFPTPFLVIGKGGAAMAVLAAAGAENCRLISREKDTPVIRNGRTGTIVNATPLGWNNDDAFPIEIPPGWSFIDLNYNPRWLWRNSLSERGVRVITGERMLVEQAACSFALWTGYTPGEDLKAFAVQRIMAESHG